jgi:tripartite-type tricarboxylate transporter receptor subunit TctC
LQKRQSLALAVALAAAAAATGAGAPGGDAWPARPIRLVVPFAPGRRLGITLD